MWMGKKNTGEKKKKDQNVLYPRGVGKMNGSYFSS